MAFLYPKLTRFLRLRFTDKDIGEFMHETVRQNLEYREKNNVVRKDFFQLLMQLRNTGQVQQDDDDWSANATSNEKQRSLDEMTAHAFIFFIGSYDSSSTPMSFCMYELAKNPVIQSKARKEINQILEERDGEFTFESIHI